jgi:hypothetical protein
MPSINFPNNPLGIFYTLKAFGVATLFGGFINFGFGCNVLLALFQYLILHAKININSKPTAGPPCLGHHSSMQLFVCLPLPRHQSSALPHRLPWPGTTGANGRQWGPVPDRWCLGLASPLAVSGAESEVLGSARVVFCTLAVSGRPSLRAGGPLKQIYQNPPTKKLKNISPPFDTVGKTIIYGWKMIHWYTQRV